MEYERSKTISVHDNIILSYSVDCQNREIKFHTEYPFEPKERTDVTFEGVACYDFWYDTVSGSIIHGFYELPPIEIYDKCENELKDGVKYGWPVEWAKSHELAQKYFEENEIRGWSLEPCLGMTGWILAKSMTFSRIDL